MKAGSIPCGGSRFNNALLVVSALFMLSAGVRSGFHYAHILFSGRQRTVPCLLAQKVVRRTVPVTPSGKIYPLRRHPFIRITQVFTVTKTKNQGKYRCQEHQTKSEQNAVAESL